MKKMVIILLFVSSIYGGDNHFYHPIDYPFLRKELTKEHDWQMRSLVSGGLTNVHAYVDNKKHDSIFNLWSDTENTLTMLDGFDSLSLIGQLRNALNSDDNGIRGTIRLKADLQMPFAAFVGFTWRYAYNFFLDIGVPFFYQRLQNITFIDLTDTLTLEDQRIHSLLTDQLGTIVEEIGGLRLKPWHRSGIGDLSIVTGWADNFLQHRAILKSVALNVRVGLTLPTGRRSDNTYLLAESFGNDGSASIFLNGGLALNLTDYFTLGANVMITHIFGNTRSRRIKTSVNQTEFLLLQKAQAYKDYGMEQNFALYLEAHNTKRTLFGKIAYTYFKHGDDKLSLTGQMFNNTIANSALSLEERTAHQMVVNFGVDSSRLFPDKWYIPSLDLFATIPFNGNNILAVSNLGINFNLPF